VTAQAAWSQHLVAGVRTPVLEGGGQGDEAVLLVHGNPGSGEDWALLADELAADVRVVAPTMPGFGTAEKPWAFDATVEGYAAHLEALRTQLGLRRVHLVLHDFGGPWGLAWAAGHVDAVASVTLVDTGVFLGYRWHRLARIWRTPVAGELLRATATRRLFRLLVTGPEPRGLPRAFVERMYDDFDPATRRTVLRLYRATDDVDRADVAATLRAADLPALVVWGRHDSYLPLALAERQREAFPSGRLEVLDRSGHWPFADDPQAFRAAVLPFLRAQVAGGRPPA
jgi:pimeloyl-ACP methyl ester carboxylesterase